MVPPSKDFQVRAVDSAFRVLDECLQLIRDTRTSDEAEINRNQAIIRPELTLMVTATPNDKDIKKFTDAQQIEHLHRVVISRV